MSNNIEIEKTPFISALKLLIRGDWDRIKKVPGWPATKDDGKPPKHVDPKIYQKIVDDLRREGLWDGDEKLDIENFTVQEISGSKLVVLAGGDWQPPQRVTIELVDGKLRVTSSEEVEELVPNISEDEVWDAISDLG